MNREGDENEPRMNTDGHGFVGWEDLWRVKRPDWGTVPLTPVVVLCRGSTGGRLSGAEAVGHEQEEALIRVGA